MKIICFKNARGALLKEVEFDNDALMGALFDEFGGPRNCTLVFKGELLPSTAETTVQAYFAEYNIPIVFVVLKRLPAIITTVQEEEEVRCRICFNDENTEEDPLFRPCKCRGSVGLVHRNCLNAWREHPDNPQAHFQCVNCNYHYRIQDSWLRRYFTDADQFAIAYTVAFLFSIICLCATCSFLIVPTQYTAILFEMVEWDPPNLFMWHLTVGLACVGGAGFLIHLNDLVHLMHNHGSLEHLVGVGLMLATNGGRNLRIFCLTGLSVAFHLMFKQCQQWSRRLYTTFGERVLEVEEDE